jgi:hypothetical protein
MFSLKISTHQEYNTGCFIFKHKADMNGALVFDLFLTDEGLKRPPSCFDDPFTNLETQRLVVRGCHET